MFWDILGVQGLGSRGLGFGGLGSGLKCLGNFFRNLNSKPLSADILASGVYKV